MKFTLYNNDQVLKFSIPPFTVFHNIFYEQGYKIIFHLARQNQQTHFVYMGETHSEAHI